MIPARPSLVRTFHSQKKEAPMSLTKLIAVAAVLSMFAVSAEARPHHHRHHHHHHRHGHR